MNLVINCGECDQRLEAANKEALREQFSLHMTETHPSIRVTGEEIENMFEEMVREDVTLVKLGDSSVHPQTLEQDVRSREVLDNNGVSLGNVEELYIEERSRTIRFLEVRASNTLGLGDRYFLIPAEAVIEFGESRVALNQSHEHIAGSPESPAKEVPSLKVWEESQKYFGFGAYSD